MKKDKSFKKLLKQMDELQESQLGKLKGGISVFRSNKGLMNAHNGGECGLINMNCPCGVENTSSCIPDKEK